MRRCRRSQPPRIYGPDVRVPQRLQRGQELLFPPLLRSERPLWIQQRYEVLEDGAEVAACDVLEDAVGDLEPGALEPADDVLTHLGLEVAVADVARVFQRLTA